MPIVRLSCAILSCGLHHILINDKLLLELNHSIMVSSLRKKNEISSINESVAANEQ